MVTMNISTEADIVNGTRGVINDIVLDHRECLGKKEIESGNLTLVYPPAMIVFRPLEATFPRFDGFEDGEIPLFPSEYTFKITTSTGPKKSLVTDNIISQPVMPLCFTKARDRQSHLFLWIFANHPPQSH